MPTPSTASTVEVNGYAARAIRVNAGLSVAAVAATMGISGAYLRMIETGRKTQLGPQKFADLCRALALTDRRALLAHPHGACEPTEAVPA